jgi:hypothetical protein
MNVLPVIAAWVFITIAVNLPNNEEALQRLKNDAEIQRLAQYLRDNQDDIDWYMTECVMKQEN